MGQQRKGMNLEELRGALASAATRRAEELERENRRLRREMKEKDRIIAERKDLCRVMFNRCIALTKGLTCMWCGHSEICEKERNMARKDKDGRAAEENGTAAEDHAE